jgi:hypothetical protein
VLNELPSAAVRANKVQAFDSSGQSMVVLPGSGTASEVLINLAGTGAGQGGNLIGYKRAGVGTVARTIVDVIDKSGTCQIDDFVVVGQTDDSVSWQNAINHAVLTGEDLHARAKAWYISTPLLSVQTQAGKGLNIIGHGSGGGSTRTQLRWRGQSSTAVVLTLRGTYYSKIQNLWIYQDTLTDQYFGAIYIDENNSTGGSPSTGTQINDCVVSGGEGVGSYGIRLGHNSFQCSEIHCKDTIVNGKIDAGGNWITQWGWVTGFGSNTKDMAFDFCGASYCDRSQAGAGVKYEGSCSGWNTWTNFSGTRNTTDFELQGDGNIFIIGGGTEVSRKFLNVTGGGNSPLTIVAKNYVFASPQSTVTDLLAVKMGGGNWHLNLEGCYFANTDQGTLFSPFYIGLGNAAVNELGKCSFKSTGNYWNNTLTLPFTDSVLQPNLPIIGQSINGNYQQRKVRIESYGDRGFYNSVAVSFPAVQGHTYLRMEGRGKVQAQYTTTRALTGYSNANPAPAPIIYKYTFPYTAFKDANTSASILFFDLAKGGKLIGCYTDCTQAFVLAGSVITMDVTRSGSGSNFSLIQTHSLAAVISKGAADADLGVDLARATAVQGGYMNLSSANTLFSARFISSVGNLGDGTTTFLTAGSVDIYMVVQDIF